MAEIDVERDRRDHRTETVHHDHNDHRDANVVSATGAPALLERVSWGAIFAGTFIALGVMFLLGLMGTAIGMNAIEPAQDGTFEGLGIGTAIWWIITSIVSLGIGGYVAGRLSGITDRSAATAHGATVWGLVTIITLWLATSTVGSILNTATGAVASTARAAAGAGQVAAQATGPIDLPTQEIRNEAEQVIGNVRDQVQAANTGQLTDRAEVAAGNALDVASDAAWYAFFAGLLALIAAVIGSAIGSPKHTYMRGHEHARHDRA